MKPITPNLWFNGNAEAAAVFYTGLFPDSRIDRRLPAPADTSLAAMGEFLAIEFTLRGQPFLGINGGSSYRFTEAVSFAIECDDQAEVDRYWDALTADGGEALPCGWCRDRFGLVWQVVRRRLMELLYEGGDSVAAERVAKALYGMRKIDIAALEAAASRA
jgi:predicted 3-demethylubiquinone-9 3-methyltransferase (glyoxalase superfamily)